MNLKFNFMDKVNKHKHFLIIIFLFMLPVLLYWKQISGNVLMYYSDGYLAINSTVLAKNALLNGEIPLWNNYVLAGSPYLADITNSFFYPLKLLALVFPPVLYTNVFFVLSLSLGGIFTYLFIKEATKKEWISVVTAVVFLTSTIIGGYRKEHIGVYSAIIWLPLALYFILRYVNTLKRKYLIFCAVAMALQFFTGNPQHSLYSYILDIFFLIYLLAKNKLKFRKIVFDLLFLGVFLVAFAAIQLFPAVEMIYESGRGIAPQLNWYSTHPGISIMSIFPYVFGDPLQPLGLYSSAEISTELYIGVIPLIYALYAIRYHYKEKLVRFFAIAAIVAFIYSSCMHIPFLGQLIMKIPVLNIFGIQSRVLFISVFSGIFCFSWGLKDIADKDNIKRLLRFSIIMTVLITVLALVIMATSLSPNTVEQETYFASNWFTVFGISIILSALNAVIIALYYLLRNKKNILQKAPYFIMAALGLITVIDVGRFSSVYLSSDFNEETSTEEIQALLKLPEIDTCRIAAIYDYATSFYGSTYHKSGLIDNRSIYNGIRNANGWIEFEDPNLNIMLDKVESRDGDWVPHMISENNDIVSMLGVKYVLCPLDTNMLPQLPKAIESVIIRDPGEYKILGDENISVVSFPISVMNNRYYKISFDLYAPYDIKPDVFYVDFYGGDNYDKSEHQRSVVIGQGIQTYNTYIYTGDAELPAEQVYARFVGKSSTELTISNVNISLMVESNELPQYHEVAKTSLYTIYENQESRELIYIADRTQSIMDSVDLMLHPENYPDMEKTSYIENFRTMDSSGMLSNLKITLNSIKADITSERGAFVNNAQSFRYGWKAYVDGKEVKVYRVNGIIQGAEVPAGTHTIEFIYDPDIVKFSALVTLIGIIAAIVYVLNQKYHFLYKKHKVEKETIDNIEKN